MSDNYIRLLGTGTSTGVPVVACHCQVCMSNNERDKRLRTSAFVQYQGKSMVIDCGPDFRQQMLDNKIEDIDAILMTHGHRDHMAGLDEVRAFNFILNKTIDVYASAEVAEQIKIEFPYIFNSQGYLGAPKINLNVIEAGKFMVGDVEVLAIPAKHASMDVFGFRFGPLTYITDVNSMPKNSLDLACRTEVLIINALRKSRHASHFSLDEALNVIDALAPRQAWLTHMSHFIGLHDELQAQLPKGVFVGYDGVKIEF